MLECKDIEPYLTVERDDIDKKRSEEVKQHLAICFKCKQLAEDLDSTWNLLDEWQGIEPSADFKETFWRKVQAREKRPLYEQIKNVLLTLNWRLVTASVALIFLSFTLYFLYRSERPSVRNIQYTQVDKLDDELLREINKVLENDPEYLSIYGDWSGQPLNAKN